MITIINTLGIDIDIIKNKVSSSTSLRVAAIEMECLINGNICKCIHMCHGYVSACTYLNIVYVCLCMRACVCAYCVCVCVFVGLPV